MSELHRILATAAICLLSFSAGANPPVSVTVAFSVYVAPAEDDAETYAQVNVRQVAADRCDQVLSGIANPAVRSCQRNLKIYTWQENHDGTLLVVEPI